MMRTSRAGIDFIKKFEGFKPRPYLCPAGKITIGYGTTHYPDTGRAVSFNDPEISEMFATRYLCMEVDEKEEILARFLDKIKFKTTPNQFDALMCFAYNLGMGPIVDADRSMSMALRSGNINAVADAFLLYCKGKKLGFKVVLPGLLARRQAERELFLRG